MVVVVGETFIVEVVESLLQIKWVPPVAVNVAVPPSQIVVSALISGIRIDVTETTTESIPVHIGENEISSKAKSFPFNWVFWLTMHIVASVLLPEFQIS